MEAGNLGFRKAEQDIRRPSETVPGNIEVSIADPEDIESAVALVDREYAKKRINKHKTPISITFVVKISNEVVGTVSMAFGNDLPMEELYKEEIKKYRDKGDKIAEVSIRDKLFKAVLEKGLNEGFDDLVIEINPDYKNLYKYFKFEDLGELKTDPEIRALATAKILRLEGKSMDDLSDSLYSPVKKSKPH